MILAGSIFVGLCVVLLVYCLLPRTRRWTRTTTCMCGYDVESLTGNDPQGPGLSGAIACPECGARLTLGQVRVRGQTEKRYAPKTLSYAVVAAAWCVVGLAGAAFIDRSLSPVTHVYSTFVTTHAARDTHVTITWTVEDVLFHATGDGERGAKVTVEIQQGRRFFVELPRHEFTRARGWAQWRLRDDAGREQLVAQTAMPDAMVTWLQQATGLTGSGTNAVVFVILREGAFGVQRAGSPMTYASTKPVQAVGKRIHDEYSPAFYATCIAAGLAWLAGAAGSMRAVYKRRTHALTYA